MEYWKIPPAFYSRLLWLQSPPLYPAMSFPYLSLSLSFLPGSRYSLPMQAGATHCKKELAVFPSPAGMSLIKLFLGGNNLVFPAQREFG